jgi:hypothetical protein
MIIPSPSDAQSRLGRRSMVLLFHIASRNPDYIYSGRRRQGHVDRIDDQYIDR